MSFWDKLDDPERSKQRVQAAKDLFEPLGTERSEGGGRPDERLPEGVTGIDTAGGAPH